ncbi:hypothetical protein GUJ93_ZPchr0002g23407 [Zizania palustris]|uniref:AB hydrolase-1 domain-containing protein n=1 Tax=Zizania palustris TaxID=103762 RepID=A0A8J5VBD0_ZIZPA|nr:hypothetical protein GUJ93_ZPchr0002g23407 [Zizania palustris]
MAANLPKGEERVLAAMSSPPAAEQSGGAAGKRTEVAPATTARPHGSESSGGATGKGEEEAAGVVKEKVVLFLHGFLGTSEDWVPMMKALSPSARVIAVDLPGHGESEILHPDVANPNQFSITVQSIADLLLKLICNITDGEVVVVGYSMGARIALHMALNQKHKISGAVIISGTPGLKDEVSRRCRSAIDKSRAHFLSSCGLESFLETWYSAKMWASLREHPKFDSLVRTRRKHNNITALSKVLADSSIGKQKSLWEDLEHLKIPLLIVAVKNASMSGLIDPSTKRGPEDAKKLDGEKSKKIQSTEVRRWWGKGSSSAHGGSPDVKSAKAN